MASTDDDFVKNAIKDVLDSVLDPAPGPSTSSYSTPIQNAQTVRSTSSRCRATVNAARPGQGAESNDADPTTRALKARMKGLEEEVLRLQAEMQDKDQATVDMQRELKALRADKAAWTKTQKVLEAQVEKYRKAAEEAQNQLANNAQTVRELSKEGTHVDKQRRAAEAEARSRDLRLQRALEDVQKYKTLLEQVKSQEKEVKDVAREDYNKLVLDNKRLEKQRSELILAFKKQMKLIDILKRQKMHLEAARALDFTEAEFMKVLELGSS